MADDRNINHMKCWLFRKAQVKWGLKPDECVEIFVRHGLFDYIGQCYDYLHLSSYNLALADLEELLFSKGVKINV